jgi:hypothetical protein
MSEIQNNSYHNIAASLKRPASTSPIATPVSKHQVLDSASETPTSTSVSFALALAGAITQSSTEHLTALGAFGELQPSASEVGDSAAIEQVQDIGVTAERVDSESDGEK